MTKSDITALFDRVTTFISIVSHDITAIADLGDLEEVMPTSLMNLSNTRKPAPANLKNVIVIGGSFAVRAISMLIKLDGRSRIRLRVAENLEEAIKMAQEA